MNKPTKADTWMPLYVADYLADTTHLNTEQHGAYFLLLMAAWKRGGRLPDDDAQLASIARLPMRAWRAHAPVLRSFFQACDGELVHGRVEREVERARELTEKRRQAGLQGGRPRKQTESKPKANGNQTGLQTETPSPSHITSEVVPFPETPKRTQSQLSGEDAARRKGSRISEDWRPGAEELEYALGEGFSLAEIRRMGEDFRDFWSAKSGADACKLDWAATWRRWVRTQRDHRGKGGAGSTPKRLGFV